MALEDLRKTNDDHRDLHILVRTRNVALLDAACSDLGVSRGAVVDALIEDALTSRYPAVARKLKGSTK